MKSSLGLNEIRPAVACSSECSFAIGTKALLHGLSVLCFVAVVKLDAPGLRCGWKAAACALSEFGSSARDASAHGGERMALPSDFTLEGPGEGSSWLDTVWTDSDLFSVSSDVVDRSTGWCVVLDSPLSVAFENNEM